jgi:flagellar biosynthetic protein FliQ
VTSDLAFGLSKQMLWTALIVAGPIIGVTMIVGLLVSVLQVVTQIQEMTLTFIPKLIVVFAILVILGPWMLSQLVEFSATLMTNIPDYVR